MGDIETSDVTINKEAFAQIILNTRALDIFQKIGVDLVGLVNHATHMYEKPENDTYAMQFSEFVECLLQLRGANAATVRDIVEVRNLLHDEMSQVKVVFDEGLAKRGRDRANSKSSNNSFGSNDECPSQRTRAQSRP